MPFALYWLAFGMFALGTQSFLVAGLLPSIAEDYAVSLADAGHLVTWFAVVYALGLPVMATLTMHVERRKMLLASLGIITLANIAAAAAPNYLTLMVLRLLMAACACLYSPGATAFANTLVPPGKRGRALGTIFSGLPLAAVFGLPLGTAVGHAFGWRASFLAVAGLGLIGFVAILIAIPPTKPSGVPGLRTRLMPLNLATVRYAAAITVVWAAGIYALFTYMAAYFEQIGIDGDGYAGVLAVFGLCAFLGNQFGGWSADHLGALTTMRNALLAAIPALALFGLLPVLPHPAWEATALVGVWAFAIFSFWPARQTQMVAIAPQSMPMLLGLNTSALYLGMAAGSALGGLTLAYAPVAGLGFAAAAVELAALGLIAGEWRAWRKPAEETA